MPTRSRGWMRCRGGLVAALVVLWLGVPEVSAHIPPKSARGPRDFVLALAGDVAYPRGWMDRLVERQGPHMFDEVRPLLTSADLAFANLESPYTEAEFATKKRWPIATPPHRLEYVLSAGFNVFSLANNHIFDCGEAGIEDTLRLFRAAKRKRGFLAWAGVAPNPEADPYAPTVFTVPGKKVTVALLAFAYAKTKRVPIPHGRAIHAIRRARRMADVVLVSVHLGKEYQHVPSPRKAALYRRYVDAGADVVIGHHPHVVQGVEVYRGRLIFHSLGNFSFASKTKRHHQTGARLYGMLPLVVFQDGRLTGAEIVPLYVNNSEDWKLGGQVLRHTDFKPQVLRGAFARRVLDELRQFTADIPGIEPRAVKRFQIRGTRGVIRVR